MCHAWISISLEDDLIMAGSAAQARSSESRPPTSELIVGLRNVWATLSRPLFAVVLAMMLEVGGSIRL